MSRSTSHVSVLPLWGSVVVTAALAAGFITAAVAGFGFIAIISGIVAACTAYSSYGYQLSTAIPRSLYFALFFTATSLLIVMTTGIPWLAAVAMAAMAFVGSVLTTAGALGLNAALMSSTAYLLMSGFSLILIKDQAFPFWLVILAALVGALVGVAMSTLSSFVLSLLKRPHTQQVPRIVSLSSMFSSMASAIRDSRRAHRDGIRRAVALGIAMLIFQSVPTHDGFLLLMTTAIVLPVYGRVTLLTVGSRLLTSFMAIGIALILPFVLPRASVTVIAILIIAYAIASALRSTTHSLAAAGMAFLLLIGAPGAELGIYAGWRLIDVAAGFVIAWVCGYVFWPKQPLMITPIPSDLHEDCEAIQLTLRMSK